MNINDQNKFHDDTMVKKKTKCYIRKCKYYMKKCKYYTRK